MPARFPAGRVLRLLAASLVVTGVLAGLGSAGASGSTCQNWTGVPPPNPGTGDVLTGVAAVSACDAWAVGSYNNGTAPQTLVEHWNGSSWAVVASPDPGIGSLLNGVQAASRTDIWAVGSYQDRFDDIKTLALHWNGTVWKQAATPNPQFLNVVELSGVRVLSANDAWAVGDASDHGLSQTLILHWNGTRWRRVASPSPGSFPGLAGVAATSASNAWAVGGTSVGTLILHWNGTKWTHVASPSLGGLAGVAATSGSNAWAVGSFPSGPAGSKTLILHWNGTRWRRVASPNPGGPAHDNMLRGVAVTSAGNAWAVGSYTSGPAGSKTLILRWNGTKWAQVASPNPGTSNQLNAVRAWSASNAWAVGSFSNGGPSQALAIHCC